jgi:hypothetical protein
MTSLDRGSRPDLHRVKMGNIRTKLSADDAPEVLAHVRAVRDAATYDAGCALAAQALETFADRFPSAMASLADDLEASLAHLKLPVRHRVNARTTDERVKDRAASWGSFWCALGSVLGVVDPGAKSRALGLQALPRSFAPLRA